MDNQGFPEKGFLLGEEEIKEWQQNSLRRMRAQRAFIFVSFIFSILLSLVGHYSENISLLMPIPQETFYLLSMGLLLAALGGGTYIYVQGSGREVYDFSAIDHEARIRQELDRISQVEKHLLDISEKLDRVDKLANSGVIFETVEAVKNSATEIIWNELSSAATRTAQQEKTLKILEQDYYRSRERLLLEVSALGRRGTVNLALGVVTTSVALLILLALALSTVNEAIYNLLSVNGRLDLIALSILLLPKISLALFVQLFSLFFLKLYKAGLAEIKYFQNELTNLEVKYLGVVAAFLAEDMVAVSEASRLLLQVERNHVLEKGQSTVELEKHKLEQVSSSEILKILPRVLSRR